MVKTTNKTAIKSVTDKGTDMKTSDITEDITVSTVKNDVDLSETKKRGRPKKEMVGNEGNESVESDGVKHSKPAYSKEELEAFKTMIIEKREEIIAQLGSLRDRMVDSNTGIYVNENSPYSLHMAELGTDAMEKEKNYLFTQREAKFLGYLDEALKRIDEKTYGYCIDCGAVIPKGRLEAVPHSQHCINCKHKFGK